MFKKEIEQKNENDKNFTLEQLDDAIDDQLHKAKKRRFHERIKKIHNKLSNNKVMNFTKKKTFPMLVPFFLVMIILVIIPIISISVYAIIQPSNDESSIFKVSLRPFFEMITNAGIIKTLFLSIGYAFVASIICVIIGYPIAYIMATMKSKILIKNVWILVTIPIWISMLLKVLGLQTLFFLLMPSSVGTSFAIIIGMVYMFLPFSIIPIYDALEARDKDLEIAAHDLGASRSKTFWAIIFPSSIPGLMTGMSLVIINAATSLVIVHYLGDGKITLITTIIESYFFKGSNFGAGAIVSILLTASVLLIMLISKIISKRFGTRGNKKWKNSLKAAI